MGNTVPLTTRVPPHKLSIYPNRTGRPRCFLAALMRSIRDGGSPPNPAGGHGVAHLPSKPLSACMVCSGEGRTVSGRVPPGGERAIYPVHMRCLIKWEDRFASFVQKEHHLCQPRRSSGGKLKCPSSSLRSSFQVGIFSHERGKHLSFTVRRSGAILPRNPLRTFHQLLLFCSVASPAPPVLAARESHVQDLLACAGMAVNNHPFHLDHAEQLLGAPGAPAVRSGWAGCCGHLSRWVWCSRAASSRATSSPHPTTIMGSLGNSTS